MRKIAALLFLCFMSISLFTQTYKMYQTRNYYNQLRLNTATGEVLQVQDDGLSLKKMMQWKKILYESIM